MQEYIPNRTPQARWLPMDASFQQLKVAQYTKLIFRMRWFKLPTDFEKQPQLLRQLYYHVCISKFSKCNSFFLSYAILSSLKTHPWKKGKLENWLLSTYRFLKEIMTLQSISQALYRIHKCFNTLTITETCSLIL